MFLGISLLLVVAALGIGYTLGVNARRRRIDPSDFEPLGSEFEEKVRALMDENKKLIKQLENMSKLLSALGNMRSLEKLSSLASRLLVEELNCDYSAVLIKKDDVFTLMASENLHAESEKLLNFSITHPIMKYINNFPELIIIKRRDLQFRQFKGLKENIKEMIMMPLKVGGEVEGILWVARKEGGKDFSASDKAILTFLGNAFGYITQNLKLYRQLQDRAFKIVAGLAKALEQKDEYTRGHSEHVSSYAVIFARHLGVKGRDLDIIRRAALLHDIGKIGIPDRVLNKAGKLTKEEFDLIKSHPLYGAELLKILGFMKEEMILILHHHEKFDGTGYPYGLKGSKIPRGAVIISLADVFDALTTDRPYRKAYSVEKALEIMEGMKGKNFSPDLLDEFIRFIRKRLEKTMEKQGKRIEKAQTS